MKRRIFCPACREILAAYEQARCNGGPNPSRKLCGRCNRMLYRRYHKGRRTVATVREHIRDYQHAYYLRRKGRAA